MKFDYDFEKLKSDLFSLPWLANNSLKEEEANQLKKAIDKSPELQKELDFLISMRTQVKMSARLYKVTDLDWKKLERDIKNQPKINYLTRLSVYSSMLSNYAAVAATLVLGLYLSNTYLEHNKDGYYEPLTSDQKSTDALNQVKLVIRFNASMSPREIEDFLKEHHLIITSVPTSADLYHVRPIQGKDSGKLIEKLETLSGKVEYIQINE